MIKIVKMCSPCSRYYTTEVCEFCRDKYKIYLDEFTTILCERFDFPQEKFKQFLTKYFLESYHEYKPLDPRGTRGTFFKIISSIFYCYANMNKSTIILSREIGGLIQSLGFYHYDYKKYIDLTIDLMISKYRRFYLQRINRTEKLKQAIKTILGKLKKPVLYDHITSFISIIGFDNPNMNINIVAMMYIMFYYKVVRGWNMNRKPFSKASGVPVGTIQTTYYSIFSKIARKSIKYDLEPKNNIDNRII